MTIGIKKAFILAGGEGTRLRPITYEMAKPLIPVRGKPVLQWNLELCAMYGVEEVIIAVGYKHEQIEQAFGDGKKLGLKIKYNVEEQFLGTAGALKFAEEAFRGEKKFIMMNGDECKDIDFISLDRVFEKNDAVAAIALTEVDYMAAGGIVKVDGEKVTNFDEKPVAEGQGKKTINAGAYILSPRIFDYIMPGEMVSIEKITFPMLVKEGKAFALPCVSQFFQTDTFERYENAIFGWKGFGSI